MLAPVLNNRWDDFVFFHLFGKKKKKKKPPIAHGERIFRQTLVPNSPCPSGYPSGAPATLPWLPGLLTRDLPARWCRILAIENKPVRRKDYPPGKLFGFFFITWTTDAFKPNPKAAPCVSNDNLLGTLSGSEIPWFVSIPSVFRDTRKTNSGDKSQENQHTHSAELKGIKQFPEDSWTEKNGRRLRDSREYNGCKQNFPLRLVIAPKDTGSYVHVFNNFFRKNYRHLNLLCFPSNHCTLDHSVLKTKQSTWTLGSPPSPKNDSDAQTTTKIVTLLFLEFYVQK